MKKICIISLLLLTFSCNNHIGNADQKAQQENDKKIKDTSEFRLLTSGLPPEPNYQKALMQVGEKWGIEYDWITGCIVPDNLMDSMEKWNNLVEKRIEAKYGKDWWKTFDKEVDAQMMQDSIAASPK